MAQRWRILRNVANCGTLPRVWRVGPTFRRVATPGHRGQRRAGRDVGERGATGAGARISSAGGLVQARVQAGGTRVRNGQIHGDSDRQPGRSQAECQEFDPPRPLLKTAFPCREGRCVFVESEAKAWCLGLSERVVV